MGVSSKPEHKQVYEAVGDLADRATKFMNVFCETTTRGKNYPCETRYNMYGARVARVMGAKHSPFEAFTVGVTRVGHFDENGSVVDDKKNTLRRHTDGPNDSRKGYDITVVYWVLLVDENKVIWRLVVIFYTRKSVGDAMERNFWLTALTTTMLSFKKEKMVMDYVDVSETLLEKHPHNRDIFSCGKIREPVWRTVAMADPMGYWSLFIWPINVLKSQFHLDKYRICELLYLSMKVCSAVTFYHVVKRWFIDGPSALKIDSAGNIIGPNFVRRYHEECKNKLGFAKGGLGHAMPRCQVNEARFFGEHKDDDHKIHEFVVGIIDVIEEANYSTKKHDVIMGLLRSSITGIGPTKSLPFYSIGVHVGLLYTDHAKAQSMHQTVGENSAFIGYLKAKIFPNEKQKKKLAEHGSMAVRCISRHLGLPEYVIENWGCKLGRGKLPSGAYMDLSIDDNKSSTSPSENIYPTDVEIGILKKKGDVFVKGQTIYRRAYLDKNNQEGCVIYEKELHSHKWKEQVLEPVL
jgi:hypothetical protein